MRERVRVGHREGVLEVKGDGGDEFVIISRQNLRNAFDFSAILAFRPPDLTRLFLLRRYNGKTEPHTNSIERVTIEGYHIHKATERYQRVGLAEEKYAEPTDRYRSLGEALQCMVKDCGGYDPKRRERPLSDYP